MLQILGELQGMSKKNVPFKAIKHLVLVQAFRVLVLAPSSTLLSTRA